MDKFGLSHFGLSFLPNFIQIRFFHKVNPANLSILMKLRIYCFYKITSYKMSFFSSYMFVETPLSIVHRNSNSANPPFPYKNQYLIELSFIFKYNVSLRSNRILGTYVTCIIFEYIWLSCQIDLCISISFKHCIIINDISLKAC